jgi:hypothetical protein
MPMRTAVPCRGARLANPIKRAAFPTDLCVADCRCLARKPLPLDEPDRFGARPAAAKSERVPSAMPAPDFPAKSCPAPSPASGIYASRISGS